MIYRPLKFIVITATILVWIRLLMGTLQVINDPNQSFRDNQKFVSQNTQIK
ncbi:hypothetical protein [Aphanothece sacrum]|uniref:hypothetical protein n=1 Tax=Aphanothece sacrum TaxID=1122 RepID=UPI001561B1A7|nr:hypothetical protein [Aphanothece sacrum]